MVTMRVRLLSAALSLAIILLISMLFSLHAPAVYMKPPKFAANIVGRIDVTPQSVISPVVIMVDDFAPQPYQGQSIYFYNRLEGDRGALNDAIVTWGQRQVTLKIASSKDWGGIWLSLNHPISEKQPVTFSAVLPSPILPTFQSQITHLNAEIASGSSGKTLKFELKEDAAIRWMQKIVLSGERQSLNVDLPVLGKITEFVIVLENAAPNDTVVIDQLSFLATTPITDTAEAAFVWSYGMLLNNWNPTTGLIRDNGKFPSGVFEAIQSTGSLAAATALAYQLGVIERADAIEIVHKISDTLLIDVPRFHGLWPHWVVSDEPITILTNTEWSSVDTVIAAIALLDAQVVLELDSTNTTEMLQSIDWNDLKQLSGISHGYTYSQSLITSTWDTFGGESWLVALAYAAATHEVPPLKYHLPPTANGSGFIDELAWLFVLPPSMPDVWGVDWPAYRMTASLTQTTYYQPPSCFAQLGLFGLSAAEVPVPAAVPEGQIYQAFGVGGQFSEANDGSALLGQPVVVPHYSAMVASLRPTEAINMWTWLINEGSFSPLNNVESLLFSADSNCDASDAQWNQLKGSWNLALQTLGWGRYLAEHNGQLPVPSQATFNNKFLREGYLLLVPRGISDVYLPLIVKD